MYQFGAACEQPAGGGTVDAEEEAAKGAVVAVVNSPGGGTVDAEEDAATGFGVAVANFGIETGGAA